jgi:hypothetical protein
MAVKDPVAEQNLDGYGAPPIPWARVRERLDQGLTQAPETGGPARHTCWLATVRPDGRPHVVPLGVLWVDGKLYFNAGPGTRKARNLAQNPSCVITVATEPFDLVFEGEASKVTDEAKLRRIAEAYASEGWQATVRDGTLYAEYSAPSAGPPPWDVYGNGVRPGHRRAVRRHPLALPGLSAHPAGSIRMGGSIRWVSSEATPRSSRIRSKAGASARCTCTGASAARIL